MKFLQRSTIKYLIEENLFFLRKTILYKPTYIRKSITMAILHKANINHN